MSMRIASQFCHTIVALTLLTAVQSAQGAAITQIRTSGKVLNSAFVTNVLPSDTKDGTADPLNLNVANDEAIASAMLGGTSGSLTLNSHACSGPVPGLPPGQANSNSKVVYFENFIIQSDTLPVGTPVAVTFKLASARSYRAMVDQLFPISNGDAATHGEAEVNFNTDISGSNSFRGTFDAAQVYSNPKTRSATGSFTPPALVDPDTAGDPYANESVATIPGKVGGAFTLNITALIGATTSSANPVLTDADGQMSLLWGADIVGGLAFISTQDGQTLFPPTSNATGDRAIAILPPNPDGVPEPASMSLVAVGVIALILRRRSLSDIKQLPLIACLTVLASLFATPAAQADFFTYNFTGTVTEVANPSGFLTSSAVVGAPVSGSFTYTDTPNRDPFSLNANFTGYTHRATPANTELNLNIGGTAAHSAASSLSNMIVGDNNLTDTAPPFFPVGDSFRYADALDDTSALFDFSEADLSQYASGQIFLADSAGGVFSSQALPAGLPLPSFDVRYGIVDIYDDDFEATGRITFRIDSVQSVPEPGTGFLVLAGLAAVACGHLRKRGRSRVRGTGRQVYLFKFGCAAMLLLVAVADRATASPYSVDILIAPYHPGLVDSWLFDINEQGQSTGYIIQNLGAGPVRSAVNYRDGNTEIVPTRSSLDINNVGDTVGNDVDFQPQFVGAGEPAVPIEIPGYFASLFSRGCLNDSGNVLIQAFPNDPLDMPSNAFSGLAIWNAGVTQTLSALDPLYPYMNPPDPQDFLSGPSSSSYTTNITRLNNLNQFAAGINRGDFDPVDPLNEEDDIYNDAYTQAYIYDGQGGYSNLEVLLPGDEIRPIDIDEAGVVLGWAGSQLALWGPTGALQSALPLPAELLNQSGAFGYPSVQRNNLGQIVGVTVAGGVQLYDPVTNAWSDITPSISGLGTGTFSTIQGFNDRGQFVGLVRPPAGGGVYGYVVSPVPEPATSVLLILAAMAGWRLRRGRIA